MINIYIVNNLNFILNYTNYKFNFVNPNVIKTEKQKFIDVLNELKSKNIDIFQNKKLKEVLHQYIPIDNLIDQNSIKEAYLEIQKEIKNIIDNTLEEDIDNEEVIYTIISEAIKKIVIDYYFINLKKDKLIIEKSLLESEDFFYYQNMNELKFNTYYFKNLRKHFAMLLVLHTNFIKKELESTKTSIAFFNQCIEFYHLLICSFSDLLKDISIIYIYKTDYSDFIINKELKQEYIETQEKCYVEMEYLKNDLEQIIEKLSESKEKVEKMCKKKRLNREKIISYIIKTIKQIIKISS